MMLLTDQLCDLILTSVEQHILHLALVNLQDTPGYIQLVLEMFQTTFR